MHLSDLAPLGRPIPLYTRADTLARAGFRLVGDYLVPFPVPGYQPGPVLGGLDRTANESHRTPGLGPRLVRVRPWSHQGALDSPVMAHSSTIGISGTR